MDFKELLIKYGVTEDKLDALFGEMKTNKFFLTGEENMDVRYPKLKADNDTNIAKLAEANTLIEQLRKSAKGNDDLQTKISEYETKVGELEAENQKLKIETATKVALLEAGGDDIDYLLYKLGATDLKLNEKGEVEGLEGLINNLKTSSPNHFKQSSKKKIDENKLDDGKPTEAGSSVTKEEFGKMGYKARVELKQNNPELYAELSK